MMEKFSNLASTLTDKSNEKTIGKSCYENKNKLWEQIGHLNHATPQLFICEPIELKNFGVNNFIIFIGN